MEVCWFWYPEHGWGIQEDEEEREGESMKLRVSKWISNKVESPTPPTQFVQSLVLMFC